MKPIQVNIPQKNIKYDITFWDDILLMIKSAIPDHQTRKMLFVIDDNVFDVYKTEIENWTTELKALNIKIKHWEESKNYKTLLTIIDELINHKFTRKDYVIALGWWMVWDLAWFAASLYKRWTNVIQIPTTLLAMLDSSVWWKTWVDYGWIKNIIWAFHNPTAVLINKNFLHTLPSEEILGWFFEWLKHSILDSREDFLEFKEALNLLGKQDSGYEIEERIKKNISYKARVVESDPFETLWNRKTLNYGHTFWHALESYMNLKLQHGICVWFWIIFANILSCQKWVLEKNICDEINDNILNILKDIKLKELNFEELFDLMLKDKKNVSENAQFVLLKDYGETKIEEVSREELERAFEEFKNNI